MVKKQNNKNNKLYTDDHPATTIKGMGFANKEKAKETIAILENLEAYTSPNRWSSQKDKLNYIKQVLVTMYYRAKHHPKRTPKMEDAMSIFREYANSHPDVYVNLD